MRGEVDVTIFAELAAGSNLAVRAKVERFQVRSVARDSENPIRFRTREGQTRNRKLAAVGGSRRKMLKTPRTGFDRRRFGAFFDSRIVRGKNGIRDHGECLRC